MTISLLFLVLLAMSAIVSLTLVAVALRHWQTPGALFFVLVLIGGSIWSTGYFFELLVPTVAGKVILDNLEFIGTDCIAIGSLLFALSYTGRTAWLNRLLPFLGVLPVVNVLMIWTDHYHHLVRTSIDVVHQQDLSILIYGYGPWMWCVVGYSLVCVLASVVIMVHYALHTHRYYQIQTLAVLLGLSAGLIGAIVTVGGLVPLPDLHHLDTSPIFFTIAYPVWAWGLFHQRLLDLVPIARDILVEHMPDGMVVVDMQQRIVDVNPGAQALFNQPATALIGRLVQDVIPSLAHRFSTTTAQLSFEQEFYRGKGGKDGSGKDGPVNEQATLWVEVTISQVYNRRDCMIGWLMVLRDRTSYHEMQMSLQQSKANLLRSQEIARLGSFYHDVARGRTLWSENLSRIAGFGHEERWLTLDEFNQMVHPDDLPGLYEAYEDVLCGKIDRTAMEVRLFAPDGSIRYFFDQFEPTRDEHGKVVAVFGTVQDITERKQIEETLRINEERMKAVVESAGVGIVLGDAQGRYTFFNQYAVDGIGYSREELQQMSVADLVHPDDLPSSIADLQRVLRGEINHYRRERRYICKDRRVIWIDMTLTAIRNQAGEIESIIGVMVDITERKRIEDELHAARDVAETANRAKSAFLANMSHELRTPLNAILGFSQLMNRNYDVPVEYREHLQIIRSSGEHLLALINDILDMSKIEAGQVTLNQKAFDLYEMLSDLEKMFRLRAYEKGLLLTFDCRPDVPRSIYTDEQKLRQVLINLLSNAVKFTQHGSVTLSVWAEPCQHSNGNERSEEQEQDREQDAHHALMVRHDSGGASQVPRREEYIVYFEVVDTGPGIAPDEFGALFEAFLQTRTGQQAQEGTGLGLPISRTFVELMGGEITIQSTVGDGAVFEFYIVAPVLESVDVLQDRGSQRQERQVVRMAAGQPAYRVLVVDDKGDNRRVLVSLLASAGFEVREASDGQAALELWEQWEPHLIWMDMRMPGMDGYEATRRIRAMPKGKKTRIIAITASAFDAEQDRMLGAGCDDVVPKPFHEQDIFTMMHKHLGVHYLYVVEEQQAESATAGRVLTPEAMAVLAVSVIQDLHQSALLGDIGMLSYLVEEIRQEHAALAEMLYTLVYGFRFEQIVKVTSTFMVEGQ
jgi:PAS domain S-box-containing protein